MGKATAGRKRKVGDRYPSGKLKPAFDRGCEGVQRRTAIYTPASANVREAQKEKDRLRASTETFDAIGRAMVNGLLDGRDLDATFLCAAGRDYIKTGRFLFDDKGLQDSLGKLQPKEGGGPLSDETQEAIERKFDIKRAKLTQCSSAAKICMMSLLAPRETDCGPDWLDRLIFGNGSTMDARRMEAALDGLEAIA